MFNIVVFAQIDKIPQMFAAFESPDMMAQRFVENCGFTQTFSGLKADGYSQVCGPVVDALDETLKNMHTPPLFPQLRELTIVNDIAPTFIMSGSVVTLLWVFTLGAVDGIEGGGFIDIVVNDILRLMPHLTTLTIEGAVSVADFDTTFGRLCYGLRNLRQVVFPHMSLGPIAFRAFDRHINITHIHAGEFDDPDEEDVGGRRTSIGRWTDTAVHFTSQSFLNLVDLSFALPDLRVATSIFDQDHSPAARLRWLDLHLATPQSVRRKDVRVFFRVLRRRCPQLLELTLGMYVACDTPEDVVDIETLDMSCISILTGFTSLDSITIDHTYPIEITDADVEIIASSWSRLRAFRLNEHPLVLLTSTLTLNAFAHLVRCCRDIVSAALYVDGFAFVDAPLDMLSISKLRLVSLGVSSFPSDAREYRLMYTAMFFSNTFTDVCTVVTGHDDVLFDSVEFMPNSRDNGLIPAPLYLLEQYGSAWSLVNDMARAFRRWKRLGEVSF